MYDDSNDPWSDWMERLGDPGQTINEPPVVKADPGVVNICIGVALGAGCLLVWLWLHSLLTP